MTGSTPSRSERRKQLEQQKKSQKKKKKSLFKKVIVGIVLLGIVGLISGGALFAYYASTAPELDEKLLKDPITSDIVDANGDLIMKFGAEKRNYVPYQEIPEVMKNAILATEDNRFEKHIGIDFYRLGGAVLANIKGGFGSQGASTLTQQVIKNTFSWQDKTLKRKAQEAWLALKLEREYSKDEIFEMYFNKILMGGNIYGFGTAAEYYFGKPLNQLELHEAALLAGMPQSPNGYNPFQNPERAEKRRNTVLHLMEKHGRISESEMKTAQSVPVESTLAAHDESTPQAKYAAYVDAVLHELNDLGMQDVLAEGVTVHTALQPQVQQAMEKAINNEAIYEENMEAGATVIDTQTGAVVAVGGGRDYSGRDFNYAIKAIRPPGSVIKPILSYGPAIENFNWSTGQAIKDEKYFYKGTKQEVRNVDGKHLGTLTMREALYRSRNVTAVKTFEEVGAKAAGDFAEGLGLHYDNIYPSSALGGGDTNFSTMQIAGAYATFGNGGMYTKPHTVKKIVFQDGSERNMAPKGNFVMKDSTAYMITDMLRDVLTKQGATGVNANISGSDFAGKTGTTNYPEDIIKKHNFKSNYVPDTWFAGYSSQYTFAAWGGFKNYTDPIKSYSVGRQVPQKIFKAVMSEVGRNPAPMKRPSSVEEATIVYGSDPIILAASSSSSGNHTTELFVRGTLPVVKEEEVIEADLQAPTQLQLNLPENSNDLQITWSHQVAEDDPSDDPVEFEVSYSMDGGAAVSLGRTDQLQAVLPGVQAGHSYTIQVTAIRNTESAGPTTASITIEAEQEPEIVEPEEPEQPVTPPTEEEKPSDGKDKDKEKDKDKDKDKEKPAQPEKPSKPEIPVTPPKDEEEDNSDAA